VGTKSVISQWNSEKQRDGLLPGAFDQGAGEWRRGRSPDEFKTVVACFSFAPTEEKAKGDKFSYRG
jgi:hypothetical protein